MRRAAAWIAGMGLLISAHAADSGLTVDLEARDASRLARAGGRLVARPGDSLLVKWSVNNPGKAVVPDVTLHVSLNRAAKGEAAYESALVMDFAAGAQGSGDVSIQAPAAAADYVLRVETIGAAKTVGREASAEMSVHVQ